MSQIVVNRKSTTITTTMPVVIIVVVKMALHCIPIQKNYSMREICDSNYATALMVQRTVSIHHLRHVTTPASAS